MVESKNPSIPNHFIYQPMNYVLFYFKTKIFTAAGVKAALLGSASLVFSAICNFVIPIYPFVLLVFFLVILDMLTGVAAAKSKIRAELKESPGLEPKTKISSRRMFRTMEKVGVYLCGILGAHAVYLVMFKSMIPIGFPFDVDSPLAYIVTFPIMWTEFKSLDENIHVLTGVTFWDYIKKLKPSFFNK